MTQNNPQQVWQGVQRLTNCKGRPPVTVIAEDEQAGRGT